MFQFHLFGWISSYLTRPGFATIKYWIELYWQYIGLFGGFARIPLQASGFSRVYYSRSPSIMTLGIHLFFPSLSWWFVPPCPINPKDQSDQFIWCMLLANGCYLGGHQHCNGHNIEAMSILLAIPIPGSNSEKIPRPEKSWSVGSGESRVMTLVTTTLWV